MTLKPSGAGQRRFAWTLRWGNPHTHPPDGKPVTLGLQITSSSSHMPTALYLLKNPGDGYALYCAPLDPEKSRRKLSESAKQNIRRRNLEKRIEKSAPLFKVELLEQEL